MTHLPLKILIVGGVGGSHVADSFLRAAGKLGLHAKILDTVVSNLAPAWRRRLNWYLLGRRPVHLKEFSEQVLTVCKSFRPDVLLTTGLAPVTWDVVGEISLMGVRTLNFLTDDPWNQAHRSAWFMKALPQYHEIYSPRRAMIDDLLSAGCGKVEYLPFGYDPELFYPENPRSCRPLVCLGSDVVFAGGADSDRVPYMQALNDAGFNLALYGSFWNRRKETIHFARGEADVQTLRFALASAKVGLCLVRRANRDGSCMRTFEVPAVGTCMLTEDTQEHRDLFGEEGDAVLYFGSIDEMLEKARLLCDDKLFRKRLAMKAHQLIVNGGHRYEDRLTSMLRGEGLVV